MIGQFFSAERFRKISALEQEQLRNQQKPVTGPSAEGVAASQGISAEAKQIGYTSGIKELTFLAQRVIDLEQKVAALEKQLAQPPHLRKVERR